MGYALGASAAEHQSHALPPGGAGDQRQNQQCDNEQTPHHCVEISESLKPMK